MAFLDPDREGQTPARAYLLTRQQLDDVVGQESALYEAVLECAPVDRVPAYTFTARSAALKADLSAPSVPYLRVITQGLVEAHGWSQVRAVEHLVQLPGARGVWTVDDALRAIQS